MTAHLFIVDRTTFPLHQEFGFAGTGDNRVQFNTKMAADLMRVRQSDEIFFYVQGDGFTGTWVASGPPYLAEPNHLSSVFKKQLPYRVPIEPSRRDLPMLSESEALDLLPMQTKDILWSPIYRKLRGGRGCSTLLPPEAARLLILLEAASATKTAGQRSAAERVGERGHAGVPISPQLIPTGSFNEAALELSVLHDLATGGALSKLLGIDSSQLEFLGNQVYAGVGMQAIDVLVGTADRWVILELKATYLHSRFVNQLAKYGRHLRARLGLSQAFPVEHILVSLRPKRRSRQMSAARAEMSSRSAAELGDHYGLVEWSRDNGILSFFLAP